MPRPRFLSDLPQPMVILAADIGGTHARFLLGRSDAGRLVVLDEATSLVAAHETPEQAVADFVGRTKPSRIDRACFAIAGPVEGRSAHLTNARWRIDADALAVRLGIDDVALCNDFEAAACGLHALDPSACVTLQAGAAEDRATAAKQARLLIGAGTGLGVAYLLAEGTGQRVVAGEGGHMAFAPSDDEQTALLVHLRPQLERVTAEHLLSGAGLERLYAFACLGKGSVPDDVREEGAAAVARRFAAGESEAVHAVRLFASIFGAVAGDHALCVLAMGGVYVAGGIAPRFAGAFADGGFMAAFKSKGSHAALMARMPVHLVCDVRLGLRGAAWRALRDLG